VDWQAGPATLHMFKRVTIIGLGLIGGSLGLAIRERRLAEEIIGVSRRQSTIRKAMSLGVVDRVTLDIKEGVCGSDFVILTAPVLTIIEIAKRIKGVLKKGVIVTDAGSTKYDVVKNIEAIFPNGASFVGSHPLAGSEKSGLNFVNKDLFKDAYCLLTKTPNTDSKAFKKIKIFWRRIGMRVVSMNAKQHDKIISKISHLPHAVSASLSNTCRGIDLSLAAGGFKDTTRISSGSPELWKDIFLTNRKNLARDINMLKKELSKLETALIRGDEKKILYFLKKAKGVRDSV